VVRLVVIVVKPRAPKPLSAALYTRAPELGREFEDGLLTLLFDTPELHRRVREYLIF
jgi:hypothetical protein